MRKQVGAPASAASDGTTKGYVDAATSVAYAVAPGDSSKLLVTFGAGTGLMIDPNDSSRLIVNYDDAGAPVGASTPGTLLTHSTAYGSGLYANIARRDFAPVVFYVDGDSFSDTFNGDTSGWWIRLSKLLQARYPKLDGTAQPAPSGDLSAAVTANGIQFRNGAAGGANSSSMMDATQRAQVAAMNPAHCLFMIGSNDISRPVATFKSDLLGQITSIIGASANPWTTFTLIHPYERMNGDTIAAGWAAYGQAMREIAAAMPTRVAYLDMVPPFEAIGVKPGGTDPFDMVGTDNFHPNAVADAYFADLIFSALTARLPVFGA